ncbi:MAG: LysM peptidoglycan-binding domain-containing protein [Myxococcota bacterium]|nr:LysM peptidoglycan-binding domain-containing protein [Myxococcota bacterium]
MKRVVFALLVWIAPAFAQDAAVDTINYRVKDGDTLSLIAAEYYGDRKKATFIMAENKIANPRPLKNGERLKIPINREITTSPNDTFETLAGTYLGDARRGVYLAEFNKMSPEDRLPAGTQLHVPFTVQHKAAGNESFTSIAASFFNDKSQAEMLRGYNFMTDKPSLEKDESIQIPIFNVRVAAWKTPAVDAEAKSRRAARRDAAQRAASNIPRAWAAWRTGEIKVIETLMLDLDVDYLDTNEAVEVSLLRGLAAAALAKKELAIESFRAVRARKESHVLRKFDYSPKILELWKEAGGSTD